MSQTGAELTIRELNSVDEMKRSEAFQRAVWGEDDPADNADIMLALQHAGGLVAGAFSDGRMQGFLLAFPTSQPGVQHSHRLAVHPDSQGMGIGRKLKWYQRDWCLARDIQMVRWTYDPLRRVNAALNIATLGATAGTYYKDHYGRMEGINAGVASDRLLAEWHLNAVEVVARANGQPGSTPHDVALRVTIPADFGAMLSRDRDAAIAERLRVRGILTGAFAEGLRISGFDTETCAYLLSKA